MTSINLAVSDEKYISGERKDEKDEESSSSMSDSEKMAKKSVLASSSGSSSSSDEGEDEIVVPLKKILLRRILPVSSDSDDSDIMVVKDFGMPGPEDKAETQGTNRNEQPSPKRSWKTSFANHRRPVLHIQKDNEKKKTSTQEVVDLAKSKKNYYDRLLGMAEREHTAKLKMLRAKTNFYDRKTTFGPKSVVHLFNNFIT